MKLSKIYNLILPNKVINIFVYSLIIFGVISGSLFLMLSNETDKNSVIEQITNFFVNINTNNIDNVQALKNSLIINYIFIISIWVLGFSIIGVIINIFLTYLKGFLFGFSIASIFLTYNYKGLPAAILYTIPSQLFNIIIITVLSIYSIMFTKHLITSITSKKAISSRRILKQYSIIFVFSIIITLISSLLEVYLFPNILKLIISLYM
mgnify:CR=1 FL=1